MTEQLRATIEQIHASGRGLAIAITGGGSGAITRLLEVPGASRSVLEAIVPYDARALADYLGFEPEHACSVETAIAMARRARDRATHWLGNDSPRFGIGCTASVVSDRPKKGDHRCYIATASDAGSEVVSIVLDKGARDRPAEEGLVATAIVWCIARACAIAVPCISSLLTPR